MSGLLCTATTGAVSLSAAAAKTVLQLVAPTNQRGKLVRLHYSFNGISPSAEPALIRILRQTTAISGSPTALTPKRIGAGSETPQFTAAASTGGTEPTAGDVLDEGYLHTQTGLIEYAPLGLEITILGGTRLGVEITSPSAVSVRIAAWWDE